MARPEIKTMEDLVHVQIQLMDMECPGDLGCTCDQCILFNHTLNGCLLVAINDALLAGNYDITDSPGNGLIK